jgi:hypothetical protein
MYQAMDGTCDINSTSDRFASLSAEHTSSSGIKGEIKVLVNLRLDKYPTHRKVHQITLQGRPHVTDRLFMHASSWLREHLAHPLQ